MPRKEKVDRGCAPAGTFGHMLFTARHKAGKSIAEMSRASSLSGPYLVHIERGIRSPVPNKVPAIATAYGVDPSEACWSWVTSFAPQMVRHLVKVEGAAAIGEKQAATSHEAVQGTIAPELLRVDLHQVIPDSPLPEDRSITLCAAAQKAKTQAILDRRMPTAQNFDFEKPTRYTQVGPRGQQPPEISRRIHEECLEDKNDAAATYRTDADDGGGRG